MRRKILLQLARQGQYFSREVEKCLPSKISLLVSLFSLPPYQEFIQSNACILVLSDAFEEELAACIRTFLGGKYFRKFIGCVYTYTLDGKRRKDDTAAVRIANLMKMEWEGRKFYSENFSL
ncbi:hypothetical protein CEXT_357131 [Caerostris extrusa]|uniref:Uncharacterized protein n=1 Tax=Caerostris extrusa TaxID=172846 RepID=A0AAV4MG90_CAEEX|nr:hypothetical protein CEXT_357131 [Caerostris extrusa]